MNIARMGRCVWLAILAAVLIASVSPQPTSQDKKSQHGNSKTVTTIPADKRATDAANDPRKGCPGTQYPSLSCEAISAQADLEQARQSAQQANQSVRQGDLFTAEVVISALTMVAAIAAAGFAASAATAAKGHLTHAKTESRPYLVLDVVEKAGSHAYKHTFTDFKFTVKNVGQRPAEITATLAGWIESGSGQTYDMVELHDTGEGIGKVIGKDTTFTATVRVQEDKVYRRPLMDHPEVPRFVSAYVLAKIIYRGITDDPTAVRHETQIGRWAIFTTDQQGMTSEISSDHSYEQYK